MEKNLSPFSDDILFSKSKRESLDYFTRELHNNDFDLLDDVDLEHLKGEEFLSPSQARMSDVNSKSIFPIGKENYVDPELQIFNATKWKSPPKHVPTTPLSQTRTKRTLESLFHEVSQQQTPTAKRPSPPRASQPVSNGSIVPGTAFSVRAANLSSSVEEILNRLKTASATATASAVATDSTSITTTAKPSITPTLSVYDEQIKEKERRLQNLKEQIDMIKRKQMTTSVLLNSASSLELTDIIPSVSSNLSSSNNISIPTPTITATTITNNTTPQVYIHISPIKDTTIPATSATISNPTPTKPQPSPMQKSRSMTNLNSAAPATEFKDLPAPLQNSKIARPSLAAPSKSTASGIPRPSLSGVATSRLSTATASKTTTTATKPGTLPKPNTTMSLGRNAGKQMLATMNKVATPSKSTNSRASEIGPTKITDSSTATTATSKIPTKTTGLKMPSTSLATKNLTAAKVPKAKKSIVPTKAKSPARTPSKRESYQISPKAEVENSIYAIDWEKKIQEELEHGGSGGIGASKSKLMRSPELKEREPAPKSEWSPVKPRRLMTEEEAFTTCTKKVRESIGI